MTKRKPILLITDSDESKKAQKMLEENKVLCDVRRFTNTDPVLLVFDDRSLPYQGLYQGFEQIKHYIKNYTGMSAAAKK